MLQTSFIHRHSDVFFVRRAAPNLRWGRKGGTPARSWLGIVRTTGPDPFKHCSRPNTYLHCMPQYEVTPAGFANCSEGYVKKKSANILC